MELEKAVEGIQKYRKLIHEENLWSNPIELSDAMVKLSVYNAYLADHIARLHYIATETQSQAYKVARDLDSTVSDAERLAKAKGLQSRKDYENIKYIYTSTGNLISVLQSRLRVIETQLRTEGQNVT